MLLCSSLLVLLLNLAVSCYAQSTSDEPPSNPPKKANGVTIAFIVVFVFFVCLLIFYYSMNIVRKSRKRKDAAALPQYVDLTPLQGAQDQGIYKPLQHQPPHPHQGREEARLWTVAPTGELRDPYMLQPARVQKSEMGCFY
ncbi:hypothetical protein RSAG8_02614, partial [Rhizoctonia solani AG-8 WAC10335]